MGSLAKRKGKIKILQATVLWFAKRNNQYFTEKKTSGRWRRNGGGGKKDGGFIRPNPKGEWKKKNKKLITKKKGKRGNLSFH